MNLPITPKETHLEGVDLDDASDVEELFSVLSGSAPVAPDGGEAPGAAPPPSGAPEVAPAVVPASTDQPAPISPPEDAPVVPSVPTPPQAATPVVPATVVPPAPVAPAPVVAQAEPAVQPPAAPVNMQALLEKQLAELAGQYALPEDDARAMLTEPEVVLPKLAAKMHQQMLAAVQQTLVSQLPQLIHSVTEGRLVEERAQNQFFTRWPQLRQHSDAVLRVGQMYRAANPKASPDDAVEQIGRIVAMSLGIAETAQPAAPAAPQAPRPAPVAPHRPAAAGGTPMVTKPAETNQWVAFADDDLHSNY